MHVHEKCLIDLYAYKKDLLIYVQKRPVYVKKRPVYTYLHI